jgi:outer membrane receptor protein involved in Fe transport
MQPKYIHIQIEESYMKVFKRSAINLAVSSLFLASAMPVYAQQAPDSASQGTAAKDADTLRLEGVVVTATSGTKSKMRSSASVTDVEADQIRDFGAHTEAEVLLLIPGIRTEATAGPGGNANISVRGLPISSGGSKYVQIQEDGLPTVQFGDMNFSNNDYWTRFDNNVDHIQTLRGGSSSVFASHAPGAVINYISRTGKEAGGNFGVTNGLNYKELRVDGDYGDRIAPDVYYHYGGYYREGEGSRHTTPDTLLGYQFKGNLTKEFNGGKGYFRVNMKVLNEHAPTTPQTYFNASLNGNTVGGFSLTPGYDGSRDSQYSKYNNSVLSVDPATHGVSVSSLLDGITSNSKSIGAEFHNEDKNGFSVDNKFRMSSNSGAFQAQFWNVQTMANYLGTSGNTAQYYNGPLKGNAVTGSTLISNGAAINTQTPDMGNLVNDVSVNKQFNLDNLGALDTRVGFYHMRQNVVQRWSISERIMQAGNNGALIDIYNGPNALTTAGLTGYNNQWGGCCSRDVDARFTTDAPYLSLNLAAGPVDFEAGVRRESFRANGYYSKTAVNAKGDPIPVVGGMDVNGDGVISGAENNVLLADVNHPGLVDYKISYTNYTLGANYRVTNDLSVFARTSKGNRAIADRLLFSPNIDAVTGLLSAGGGETAALAPVKQTEVGAKLRGKVGSGSYGLSATLFRSTNEEFDFDQTRLPANGPKLNQVGYKADGVELESVGSIGNFSLNANVVYSKEVYTSNLGNPGAVGKTSGGVPKWRYTISPRYSFGPAVVGATIRGQGEVFVDDSNTNKIDGHYIVNAFANYDFGNGLTGVVNVSNLLDKLACAGGGGFAGGTNNTVFNCSVETGRTASVSVRYAF